jgi:hypothetical protein
MHRRGFILSFSEGKLRRHRGGIATGHKPDY